MSTKTDERLGIEVRLPGETEWAFLAGAPGCRFGWDPLRGPLLAQQAMARLRRERPDVEARFAQVPDDGDAVRVAPHRLLHYRGYRRTLTVVDEDLS